MIVVDGVSKVYRRGTLEIPVLQGIHLSLSPGDFIALMGPSGSGKTTLLNLIAGLDRPTAGRISVGGKLISEMNEAALAPWRARNVGFIFQLYNLIPVLTAFENVELPLLLTSLPRKERRDHARAALEIVSLADRMQHYPRQLSGGQEQRVAIARAIATDPLLFVADEPTGDLDAKSAEEILDLLNRLNEEFEKTIVMVTHDPKAASRAHKMVHLEKGQLVEGPLAAVRERVAAGGPVADSFPASAIPSPSLEQHFVRRVVSAMAEYAHARTGASPPPLPTAGAAEGFEGLTTSDVLELIDRLDGLFVKPETVPETEEPAASFFRDEPPGRDIPQPPSAVPRGRPAPSPSRPTDPEDRIAALERMLAEERNSPPSSRARQSPKADPSPVVGKP